MLKSFVRSFETCKWVCCSIPLLMPPKTTQKFEDILQEVAWPSFQQTPRCWAVYFSRHLGKAEEIPSSTFAVSWLLWSFLQICAQPGRVKCCRRVACRAALLPCQLCMSFVYIWFGRTFHDKNQGLQATLNWGVSGQGHGRMGSEVEDLHSPSAGCPPNECVKLPGASSP